MEPLPETQEALAEFVSLHEPYIEELVYDLAERAASLVPQLVGLSLGLTHQNLTFTLVASNAYAGAVDAAQYRDGGPCVDVLQERPEPIETSITDPLDETRWRLFARVSAALGVASSLSMPIYQPDGAVIGGVNLYASTEDAFAGRYDDLAQALGGRAAEAVRDADLSFSTRLEAVAAPQRLRETRDIEVAVGLLAAQRGIDVEEARRRLTRAAAQAGLKEALVARVMVLVHARRQE